MSTKEDVVVQIFDQTYRLTSDEHDADYVRRAAAYLDGKMRAAASAAANRSTLDVAVLAALEIADEVIACRRRQETMLHEVDQRIGRFTRRLEAQGRPPPGPHPS